MLNLKVGELEEHLAKRKESTVTAKLGEFAVTDDATVLTITSGVDKTEYELDDTAHGALAKYLKVPTSYFTKLDPDFRATVLRYEFERNKDADTSVEAVDNDIIALHQPSQVMLPQGKVTKVIEKVFKPEDNIRRLITNENRLHIDVTTPDHSLLINDPEVTHEYGGQTKVGDYTEAGIRFLAYPFRSVAPSVNLYAHRLICMNGQTTDERLGRISLKGRTVDEVIAEMEEAANLLLPQLDEHLAKMAQTREMYPPGSPQAFAAQLAREANVSRKVLDAVLDIVNQLPEPVSVWDVQNAFTSVANQVETYATMTRLQTLGGSLSFTPEEMIQRCGTCERRL